MNKYRGKKILVTGGAGFIGSHLVEKLIQSGAKVSVLDNFSTGFKYNLDSVKDKITLYEGTITDYKTCLEATIDKDFIFHCAAQTSVPESLEKPFACYETNVQGTYYLLEAARINCVSRLIFSSSSAVYGQQSEPCKENAICNPTSIYGLSKLLGEMLCKKYYELYGLETVFLRYFNVYGERQNPQGAYAAVVAKFRYSMKCNEPIKLFGDGLQTRDFISVHEVVKANLRLGMLAGDKVVGQAFNIATGKSITLLELIEQLKAQEFPDYQQPVNFAPARAGDIKTIQADCSKVRSLMA